MKINQAIYYLTGSMFFLFIFSCEYFKKASNKRKVWLKEDKNDTLFLNWYLNNEFDSLFVHEHEINTKMQYGLLVLSKIEIDSINDALDLMPDYSFSERSFKIPENYELYEALACVRIAELSFKDFDSLLLMVEGLYYKNPQQLIIKCEYAYLREMRKPHIQEHFFPLYIDTVLSKYPKYYRGRFLKGCYNYFLKNYETGIPTLTNLYQEGYKKDIVGYFIAEYYLKINYDPDSAGKYEHLYTKDIYHAELIR